MPLSQVGNGPVQGQAALQRLLGDSPPVLRLALAYAPRDRRLISAAALSLDLRLAQMVRSAREPMLAQIRLAWWRDALAGKHADARGDAVLDGLRASALTDDQGQILHGLVDAWETMLVDGDRQPDRQSLCARRGAIFRLFADQGEGIDPAGLDQAGSYWAAWDFWRHSADLEEAAAWLGAAQAAAQGWPGLPRAMRLAAILRGLARNDIQAGQPMALERPGTLMRIIRFGLIGR